MRSMYISWRGANALLERYLGSSGNLSLDSLVTLPYSQVIELQAGRLNITIESATLSRYPLKTHASKVEVL